MDAVNVASYADPVGASTLASGFVFPGDPSSNLIYVDTGTNPDNIVNAIEQAENGPQPGVLAMAAPLENDLLALLGDSASADQAVSYLAQGHSMAALENAIDAQSAASSSGQTMTAGQLQGSSSLTPLVTEIESNPQTQQVDQVVQSINNWAVSHGLGSDDAGEQTLESELNDQNLTGASVISTADGFVVLLANGTAYGLDSNGQSSVMTPSTTTSGEASLTIVNSDGSSVTEIANADGGATITSADPSGNPTDIMTVGASGGVTSNEQFNADGSQDQLTYNALGEAVTEVDLAPDGSLTQTQSFSYDSSDNLASITTDDGSGNLVSMDAYNSDGSHVLTDYASGIAGGAGNDNRAPAMRAA